MWNQVNDELYPLIDSFYAESNEDPKVIAVSKYKMMMIEHLSPKEKYPTVLSFLTYRGNDIPFVVDESQIEDYKLEGS